MKYNVQVPLLIRAGEDVNSHFARTCETEQKQIDFFLSFWRARVCWPLLCSVLRIRDVYPGSRILIFTHPGSRISDPGSKNSNKREGRKKKFLITFYVATNFTKLKIILVLKCWRKKFGQIFKELKNFLPKKLSLSSQKFGFGIRDPGVKKAPVPGSGSATLPLLMSPILYFWEMSSFEPRELP